MIHEYENTLRRLIIEMIGGADDSPYKVSEERLIKWKQTRESEARHFNNILKEKRLIFFSELYDLQTIINKNWELFSPILKDKKRFSVFFSEVEGFRNSIAHGRKLTLAEETLLSGITSDLKNLIVIYHNKNEMKEDYFIRITRITDNFGNDRTKKTLTYPILRVGDEYELFVEATDPKGREIEYELSILSILQIKQNESRFTLKITNEMVDQYVSISIYARTNNAGYKNQDMVYFGITVLPRLD